MSSGQLPFQDVTTPTSGSAAAPNSLPSYPMPAYLNFCPGGLTYESSSNPEAETHSYELSGYSQTPVGGGSSGMNSPGTPRSQQQRRNTTTGGERPDAIVYKAKLADDRLRLYTLLYGGRDPSLPFFVPSLSVLANAAFGRLTGVPPASAKTWADAMVLQYLDGSEHEEAQFVAHLQSEEQILSKKPAAMKSIPPAETTVNVLRRLLQEGEARHSASAMCTFRPRPCGYVFKRGDIAWNCRTCQTDSTCVICDSCFRNSNHEGHEVFFHRTTPGGCCDCGDVEAWKIQGLSLIHI